jgi:hypothetical protein
MKQLMATHWDEDKLLAETERVEAMVDPHLSREQRRKVDYEKIRRFIRNRRADVEREISGDDMPVWMSTPRMREAVQRLVWRPSPDTSKRWSFLLGTMPT